MRSTSLLNPTRIATIVAIAALAIAMPAVAQRGDDADRASKNGRLDGKIGNLTLIVEYGRPNVKGRDIWGGLVPFGRVWRTGADEATTITLSADAMIEGQHLMAGTYGLFTVPGAEMWEVIFNKVPNQWGAFNYDESKDALRVEVSPRPGEFVESLEFVLDGSQLVLRWEKLEVPVTIAGH